MWKNWKCFCLVACISLSSPKDFFKERIWVAWAPRTRRMWNCWSKFRRDHKDAPRAGKSLLLDELGELVGVFTIILIISFNWILEIFFPLPPLPTFHRRVQGTGRAMNKRSSWSWSLWFVPHTLSVYFHYPPPHFMYLLPILTFFVGNSMGSICLVCVRTSKHKDSLKYCTCLK